VEQQRPGNAHNNPAQHPTGDARANQLAMKVDVSSRIGVSVGGIGIELG